MKHSRNGKSAKVARRKRAQSYSQTQYAARRDARKDPRDHEVWQ